MEQQIEELEKTLVTAKQKIDQFNEAEEDKKRQIFSLQQKIHQEQTSLNRIVGDLNEVKVALARIETKKEDLFASIRRDLGEDYRPKIERELKQVDIAEQEQKIFKLKRQLGVIGGLIRVEKEYQKLKSDMTFSRRSEDLGDAIRDLEKVVVELNKIIKKKFEEEFRKINKIFPILQTVV